MSNYVISCCSTADLSKEHFETRDIHYVCFHYYLNEEHHLDDLGQSVPLHDFYQAMMNGAETRTSQVNVEEYVAYFTPFLEAGKDVLHLTLSTGLSGTYNSACIARDLLKEKFPDRKVTVIDSLGASSGYGLIMDTLCDMRDAGKGYDEVCQFAEKNRLRMHHWFFSTDLTYYVKGGRISKTAGMIGNMLHICPVLNMNHLGQLVPRDKVRTTKRAIARVVEEMAKHAQDGLDYAGKCFVCHSDCMDVARQVADAVEATFQNLKGRVLINNVGTVIGCHTGPGTVALFFWGDERVD